MPLLLGDRCEPALKAGDVSLQPWPGLAQLPNQSLDRFCPQFIGIEVAYKVAKAQILLKLLLVGFLQNGRASNQPVVHTAEEATAIRPLLPARQFRVLLVTSVFHICRSQRLFERLGMQVMPFTVVFKARGRLAGTIWCAPSQWLPSARALDQCSRSLREQLGRLIDRAW